MINDVICDFFILIGNDFYASHYKLDITTNLFCTIDDRIERREVQDNMKTTFHYAKTWS